MKKLDRYIIKQFLGTFFYAILLFAAVTIVVDISEKIDEFIEKQAPFNLIITDYYLNFVPHIIFMLSPLFIFITVIFFTSRLAARSEIIAILSSGISFYRILLVPYFFAATVLVGIQLYGNHFLVPNANKNRLDFEYQYIRKQYVNRDKDIHVQIAPNTFVYMETYNNRNGIGRRFTLEKIKDRRLSYKLAAKKIEWDKEKEHWKLTQFTARSLQGNKEVLRSGDVMDTTMNLLPGDFENLIRYKEAMTTPELTEFIEKERLKGSPNVNFYLVEKYRRTAIPFGTFILTIIGFSIACRKVRGGTGYHLFFGIVISAAYILFLQFSTTFATNGGLSPLLSVWIPNILVGLLSLYLMKTAPK